MLPLAVARVIGHVETELAATDATPGGGGRARAKVTFPIASELYRLGEPWG